MPRAPPIVGRYGKRPHSRMRRLQLRTVHDLISSPRAFAGRAAPKERLVDSAGVPAPRLSGAETLSTYLERGDLSGDDGGNGSLTIRSLRSGDAGQRDLTSVCTSGGPTRNRLVAAANGPECSGRPRESGGWFR